ncbi:MAG: recombination mediator RecR [Pseudomonadota bacterium]
MTDPIGGPEIQRLIQQLAKLPGFGPRSARKAALHLLKQREAHMAPLAAAMTDALAAIETCSTCGNIDTRSPCGICADNQRDPRLVVVVEDVSDVWALERAGVVEGRYHILGGVLSPLDGVGPDQLNIPRLLERIAQDGVQEVILALNVTVEGQSTAHYIADTLAEREIKVTRLAQGVPVGGELDYLDDGTLAAAIRSRRAV